MREMEIEEDDGDDGEGDFSRRDDSNEKNSVG